MEQNNTRLPAEVVKNINDAACKSASIQEFHYPADVWSTTEVAEREHIAGYELGATRWAHWKVKYDELKREVIKQNESMFNLLETNGRIKSEHQQLKDRCEKMEAALEWIKTYGPDQSKLGQAFIDKALAGGLPAITPILNDDDVRAWKDGKGKEIECPKCNRMVKDGWACQECSAKV